MTMPPFEAEPPASDTLTEYDERHLVTYLRLLDAQEDPTATWEEACRLVLRIDPAQQPVRARRAYDTHMARARWMTESGYQHLLREARLY